MASRRSPTVHGASILSLPHPLLAPSTHQRQSARVGGGGGGGCGRCNPTSFPVIDQGYERYSYEQIVFRGVNRQLRMGEIVGERK